MTDDQKFMDAIEALGLHIEPSIDTSACDEYVVISCAREGCLFGDDAPIWDTLSYEVYYAAPLACNREDLRDALRDAIRTCYGAHAREEDVSDAQGQLWRYTFSAFGDV